MEILRKTIKWVLCFASTTPEGKHGIIVRDSLDGLPLMNLLMNISDASWNNLNVFNSESYDTLEDLLHSLGEVEIEDNITADQESNETTVAHDTSTSETRRYIKVNIPISKSLYMKITEIMKNDDHNVWITDSEIAEFAQHLLLFMDEKVPMLYRIDYQTRYDERLVDRIEKLCSTRHAARNKAKQTNLYVDNPFFNDLMLEIQNVMYYCVVEDKYSNMLLASETGEYEKQSPRFISFEDFRNLSAPNFLKMESKFLITNREYMKDLCTHFSESGNNRIVVDVDFSDLCNNERNWKELCYNTKEQQDVEAITSEFLKSSFIKRLIIRLKKVMCDFNMFFVENENVDLYFDHCTINKGIVLPCKLTKISIVNSTINTSLEIPVTLKVFILQRTVVEENCNIYINSDCKSIFIDRVTGAINIPFLKEYNHFSSHYTIWSFELQENADGSIDKLTMSDCSFSANELNIRQIVRVLTLINFVISSMSRLIIHENIKNVTLREFSGSVDLFSHYSAVHFRFDLNNGELIIVNPEKGDNSRELTISNGSWTYVVNLSDIILKTKNSDFSQYNGLQIHGIRLKKIVLSCCKGMITCDDRIDGIIFDEYFGYFSIQDLNKPVEVRVNNTICMVNCYELTMRNMFINTSLKLSFNIKKICLKHVRMLENSIMQIDSCFESLVMFKCSGKFSIPNISYNDEFLVNLPSNRSGRIEITKTSTGLYNITITDMKIESEFKIQTDVDCVKLENVSVTEGSNIIFVGKYNNLKLTLCFDDIDILNFLKSEIFNRIVTCDSDLTNKDNFISILFGKFLRSETVSKNDTSLVLCLHSLPDRLHFSHAEFTISLYACSNVKSFPSSEDNVPFDILDIVSNLTIAGPEQVAKEKEFPVINFLSTGLDKLKLVSLYIGNEFEITKNVTDLQIISIEGSTLRINANVENLFVSNSTITIDISKISQLEKLTLIDSPFIYDRNIYQSLSYLRFDKMSVGKNIYLAGKLKTLIIESTNICDSSVLKIDATVINLSIQNSAGNVNISGLFRQSLIELCKKETIKLRRDKHSLALKGFTFRNDVIIDDGFKTVKLSEIDMISDTKVILNKECEYFELDSSDVDVDYSHVDSLKHVTLKKMKWLAIKEILALKTVTIATYKEMEFENEFICPANIRVISLRCVKMLDNSVFRVNGNCEEVTLFSCVGKFDLSSVACLKKLAVMPSANSNDVLEIDYPSLDNVIDLELAYELSGKYFGDLLTKCNNFKRFTLHKLWCGKEESGILISYTVHNDLYQDIIESENALVLKAYVGYDYVFVDNGVLERQCMLQSSVIMNKVFYDSFNYSMKIRLTYLNLGDFELDERNVKMLTKFSNLETLILSGCSVKGDFFLYLPVYLKTLKLGSTPIIDDAWVQDDKGLCFTMKGFRSHQNLKSLVLNDRFLRVDSFFNNLPVHLESLEFVLFVKDVRLKLVRNFKKICLKSFTVKLIENYDVKSPIEDSMKRDEIRISIFSQFAGFIEFEKLEELKFEVDGEVMVLDTETYEIKYNYSSI